MTTTTSPVIVGIDGSDAAVNAAVWAVDEALARGVPLQLLYATKPKHLGADDYDADIHRGREALQSACAAVEVCGLAITGPVGLSGSTAFGTLPRKFW